MAIAPSRARYSTVSRHSMADKQQKQKRKEEAARSPPPPRKPTDWCLPNVILILDTFVTFVLRHPPLHEAAQCLVSGCVGATPLL